MRFHTGMAAKAVAVTTAIAALGLAGPRALGAPVAPDSRQRTAQRLGAGSFSVPRSSTQLIVGVAPAWDSSTVVLQRYERRRGGKWKQVGGRFDGRLGANGLAWGRGLHPLAPVPEGAGAKREGDDRSPAGVFTLGQAFGFERDVARHWELPYLQVTPYDLLVEDPASPLYNAHIRLDHLPATPWERAQQMEQRNPAHALEVVINHNVSPHPVSGAGSAILFHIWRRDGASNTSGCTTMHEGDLRALVAWIDPTRSPLYVLLPQALYDSLAPAWALPASMTSGEATAPSAVGAVPDIRSARSPVPAAARPVTKAVAPTTPTDGRISRVLRPPPGRRRAS